MKPAQKYLFRAVYANGEHYDQNLEDISVDNPDKGCYTDLKLDQIRLFILSNGLDSYALDLTDGGISVNGTKKFYLTPVILINFKLIYYKHIALSTPAGVRSLTVNYVLGYTATNLDGSPVTHNIIIK